MPLSAKNFIVYKSSAGSGKTYTLVKQYLKLALGDKNSLATAYKSILAITFTNKAASEMKWRIIKALKEIGIGSNEILGSSLSIEMQISINELKERAAQLLTNILHHYSDFSIGTIDSFTHRIIRTFSTDLKLPINFQIETDVESVFKKVTSILINNLGIDKQISDFMVAYSMAQVEDNKHWDPEQTLIDFLKEINKEGIGEQVGLLAKYTISDFEKIRQQLVSFIKQYESVLREFGNKGLLLIKTKGLSNETFAYGKNGICNLYNKLAEVSETSDAGLFKTNVEITLTEDKWHSVKATGFDKANIDAIKDQLKTIALEARDYVNRNHQKYVVFKMVQKNIHAMGLINELAKLTAQFKADENILFISEFNERISAVVNNEPTPFVFERLGDRYKHFLLDEFQDTSAMQWRNMLPLIDNALSNAGLNLIVGDGKQSIYRWRNANVEQFVNLPNIAGAEDNPLLNERQDSLIRNFEENILNTNYRSRSVIVKFNNSLFNHLSSAFLHENLQKIYFKQEQLHSPEISGYVSLNFPALEENDSDIANTELILNHVQQALLDNYSYNDICIIVRENRHGNTVANFLISHNIPVVSSDSLLLVNSAEVNVLVAFLKYLSNQRDLVSACVVVNYFYDKELFDQEKYVTYLRDLNIYKNKTLFNILTNCGLNVDVAKLTSSNLFDTCIELENILELNASKR